MMTHTYFLGTPEINVCLPDKPDDVECVVDFYSTELEDVFTVLRNSMDICHRFLLGVKIVTSVESRLSALL